MAGDAGGRGFGASLDGALPEGAALRVIAPMEAAPDRARAGLCRGIEEELRVRVHHAPDRSGMIAVCAEGAERATDWAAPHPRTRLRSKGRRRDEAPLPWSTRLAVNHRDGKIDLTVRFFDGDRSRPSRRGAAKTAEGALSGLIRALEAQGDDAE
jgi:hypothetical protein